nr:23S rRNA (uracil(747)-C(5))-methyltransferase RlmC [Klebsiella pneumoniae]
MDPPAKLLSDQSGGSQPAVRHGPRLGARCRSSICGICFAALGIWPALRDADDAPDRYRDCPEAIACARQSAAQLGLSNLHFQALDSTQFATHEADAPQLVLVNPPRRGIGAELCDYLSRMAPPYIIYSSCNARTMATDIARLSGYRVERVQLFDMFPHTAHYEVLTLLVREV